MRRHRFEPARLLMGLALTAVAVGYVLDVAGQWRVPRWVPLTALPCTVLAVACVALLTRLIRRVLRHRRDRSTREGEAQPSEPPLFERDGAD